MTQGDSVSVTTTAAWQSRVTPAGPETDLHSRVHAGSRRLALALASLRQQRRQVKLFVSETGSLVLLTGHRERKMSERDGR